MAYGSYCTSLTNTYVVISRPDDKFFLRTNGVWEAYNASNYLNYVFAGVQAGATGIWFYDIASLPGDPTYLNVVVKQAASTPSSGALPADTIVSAGSEYWDGVGLVGSGNVNVERWNIQAVASDPDSFPIVSVGRYTDIDNSFAVLVSTSVNLDRLDATISSRASAAAVAALPTAAQNATAWGSSVIGNGRTRDYFLQGGANKVSFAADGLSFTVFSTDDATPLYTGSSTRLATTVGGLREIDPA